MTDLVTPGLWSDDTYRALLADYVDVKSFVQGQASIIESATRRVAELESYSHALAKEVDRLRAVIAYHHDMTHGRQTEPLGTHLAALRDLP